MIFKSFIQNLLFNKLLVQFTLLLLFARYGNARQKNIILDYFCFRIPT